MARNNNAATATATAKPAAALRAATAIGRHGLGAVAKVNGAAGIPAASAKRYGALANGLTPAFATATFTLTPLGRQCVGVAGCIGRNGQPTAMGLTACALANANGGQPATGAAIVAAILGNPQLVAALLGTKANGTHVVSSKAATPKWAQGYVNGLCRPAHGLATKVA